MASSLQSKIRVPIDWVVCAAGNSQRFRARGFTTAKPRLRLRGTSMLERAISSLELLPQDQVIVISRKADGVAGDLAGELRRRYPWVRFLFHELTRPTAGQLATVLTAKHLLRKDAALAIWNCDTYFQSSELLRHLRSLDGVDGIIPCAKASGAAWSYVASSREGFVTAIAEKKVISRDATVGLYFFTDARLFLRHAPRVVRESRGKEAYVSFLYDELLRLGHRIRAVGCDVFLPFGTPEQVRRYWQVTPEQLRAENPAGVIVVDLDGTLTVDDKDQSYADKKPRPEVIRRLRHYKARGYQIIVHTARNMKTRGGDEAQVIAHVGADTLRWLRKHRVPFDGIRFGKPFAREGFYLDDRAVRPSEFLAYSEEAIGALLRREA